MKKEIIIGMVCLAAGMGLAGCKAGESTTQTTAAVATETTDVTETTAATTTTTETKASTTTSTTTAKQTSTTKAANSTKGYSDQELCDMAQNYYHWTTGYKPPISEVDSTDGNIVTIHLYEVKDGHTATSAWYEIDRTTGKGKNTILDEAVDLTEVLK